MSLLSTIYVRKSCSFVFTYSVNIVLALLCLFRIMFMQDIFNRPVVIFYLMKFLMAMLH